MYEELNVCFRLRVWLGNGRTLAVTAWDNAPRSDGHRHRIDVRARVLWTEDGKRRGSTPFKRGDTWCGVNVMHATDSKEAKALVLSLLAMRPGDTDEEYFAFYTEEQLAFANDYSDDITCARMYRYGDDS